MVAGAMHVRSLLFVLLVCGTCVVAADEPQRDAPPAPRSTKRPAVMSWRRHFVVRDPQKNVVYEVTDMFTFDRTRYYGALLIRDTATRQRMRITHESDYEKKQTTYTAEEMNVSSFVRLEFGMSHSGSTPDEALKEFHTNFDLQKTYDGAITYVTNTVRRTALESQWRDEYAARAWRTELRMSLAPSFLEFIDRLRELVLGPHSELTTAEILFRSLYHGTSDEWAGSGGTLVVEQAPPDCQFDADMGYECSEAQRKRIRERTKAGKPVTMY